MKIVRLVSVWVGISFLFLACASVETVSFHKNWSPRGGEKYIIRSKISYYSRVGGPDAYTTGVFTGDGDLRVELRLVFADKSVRRLYDLRMPDEYYELHFTSEHTGSPILLTGIYGKFFTEDEKKAYDSKLLAEKEKAEQERLEAERIAKEKAELEREEEQNRLAELFNSSPASFGNLQGSTWRVMERVPIGNVILTSTIDFGSGIFRRVDNPDDWLGRKDISGEYRVHGNEIIFKVGGTYSVGNMVGNSFTAPMDILGVKVLTVTFRRI